MFIIGFILEKRDNEHPLVFPFLGRAMYKWLGKQQRCVFSLLKTVGKRHGTLARNSSRDNNNSLNCVSFPETSCMAVLQSLRDQPHTSLLQV